MVVEILTPHHRSQPIPSLRVHCEPTQNQSKPMESTQRFEMPEQRVQQKHAIALGVVRETSEDANGVVAELVHGVEVEAKPKEQHAVPS